MTAIQRDFPDDPLLGMMFVPEPNTGCWLWTGVITKKGYGQHGSGKEKRPAHRAVWEDMVGRIPPGLELDHLCRERSCVNPRHLELVHRAENLRRAVAVSWRRAGNTSCPKGHRFQHGNIYTDPRGGEQCLRCIEDYRSGIS